MHDPLLAPVVALRAWATTARHRLAEEHGEGVISAAIAVLIMAFLGAAMWLAFKGMFQSTADNTKDQVDQIGR